MSKASLKTEPMDLALAVVTGILTFQITSLIVSVPFLMLHETGIPFFVRLSALRLIAVPASGVAMAILVARRVEENAIALDAKSRRNLLIIVSVLALFSHLRVSIHSEPVSFTAEELEEMARTRSYPGMEKRD